MKNLELLSLSCSCCGAKIDDFQGKDEVTCEFCNNKTRILRPINVQGSKNLEEDKKDNFKNLVQIMEQSMIAENYKEAYNYCNKALEIDPSCGAIWENKAICCFWLRSDNNIIESQAKEIMTYLSAAKANDPDSETYDETSKNIAFNLYFAAYYRYLIVQPDTADKDGNISLLSYDVLKLIVSYLNMMELAFDLDPKEDYLNTCVRELTNLEKAVWINIDKKSKVKTNAIDINAVGFNALKSREKYLLKIRKINASYIEPEFPKDSSGCFIATATMGSYDHPVVMDLRFFRDEWILTKSWGQGFVDFYYKYGPYPADFIKDKKWLKKISYYTIVKPLHVITKILK